MLLEAEGKYLTLGNEWIGSLVKYEQESICYSKLFASDDRYYTDQNGVINDECEYFGHGIINDEKIYLQNYVFDVLFEHLYSIFPIMFRYSYQKVEVVLAFLF